MKLGRGLLFKYKNYANPHRFGQKNTRKWLKKVGSVYFPYRIRDFARFLLIEIFLLCVPKKYNLKIFMAILWLPV